MNLTKPQRDLCVKMQNNNHLVSASLADRILLYDIDTCITKGHEVAISDEQRRMLTDMRKRYITYVLIDETIK